MFKTWQIFVFSLIPLALVFAGVIIGSYDGIDTEPEVFATAPPPTEGPPPTPSAPGEVVLQLVAENILFDQRSLSDGAGDQITIEFENRDAGVLHNFALYTDQSANQSIFVGDLVTGPTTTTYSFEAPASGTYFYRCDVHPDTMTGSFTVN